MIYNPRKTYQRGFQNNLKIRTKSTRHNYTGDPEHRYCSAR